MPQPRNDKPADGSIERQHHVEGRVEICGPANQSGKDKDGGTPFDVPVKGVGWGHLINNLGVFIFFALRFFFMRTV